MHDLSRRIAHPCPEGAGREDRGRHLEPQRPRGKDRADPTSCCWPRRRRAWGHFKSEAYDRIIGTVEKNADPEAIRKGVIAAHQIIVDEAPYLFVVHDLNPRAMSPKVKGFVQAQSWFQDFVKAYMEK